MFRRRLSILALTTLALIGASYAVRSPSEAPATAATAPAAPTVDTDELNRLIDLFTQRAAERSESLEYRTLGSLLLQRADLEAAVDDYRGATDAFAAALDRAPGMPDALHGHARAALGIHDFTAAARSADALLALDPADADAIALSGDVAYAVGDDATAASAFDELALRRPSDPAVLVRLAQVELHRSGPDIAMAIAADAVAAAEAARLPAGDLAFYQSFAGNLAFSLGAFTDATPLLERAVANAPDDHGALGELARVRAATGDLDAAVELLERANALIPEPDHLFLQADLRRRLGDEAGAAADDATGVALATRNADHERAWARALATYLLDNGGDIDAARRLAADELAVRNDAGAWDLSAWASYRAGDLTAARTAIDVALSIGTPSATMWYHAGVISMALGNHAQAIDELTAALAANPGFDPILSIDAQDRLERLIAAS